MINYFTFNRLMTKKKKKVLKVLKVFNVYSNNVKTNIAGKSTRISTNKESLEAKLLYLPKLFKLFIYRFSKKKNDSIHSSKIFKSLIFFLNNHLFINNMPSNG